jgi:hypothetical protein
MSPDIEWHIGEEAESETVLKTPPRKPPRWRALAIMIAIGLGVTLGTIYHSIPEPAPRPTPALLPALTPTSPPTVADSIERESTALATGDLQAFMDLQDSGDSAWRQTQLGLFRTWGTPASGPLYSVIETGSLSADRKWADVIQFRADQYFRQTRFYQFKDQRWQRIAPVSDLPFWGDEQTAETAHFNLKFRAQDAPLATILAQRYEAVYARACGDLQCQERNAFPANRKLLIVLQPYLVTPRLDLQNDRLIYILSSPRLSGLYFQVRQDFQPGQDRSLNQAVVDSIVYYVARASANPQSTWPIDTTSQQFLGLIADWESLRLAGRPDRKLIDRPEQLASPDLPDLATLWTLPPTFTQRLAELRWLESAALITFLDEQYGADKVVAFLHTLGRVSSLPDAIKRMELSDRDFEQHWQAWLQQVAAAN